MKKDETHYYRRSPNKGFKRASLGLYDGLLFRLWIWLFGRRLRRDKR